MKTKTHLRCDACRRRYPINVIVRGASFSLPGKWIKRGTSHICKRCAPQYERIERALISKNKISRYAV